MTSKDEAWLSTMDLRVFRVNFTIDGAIDTIYKYVEDTIKRIETIDQVNVKNHIYMKGTIRALGEFIGFDPEYVGNLSYHHNNLNMIDIYIQGLDEITMM
jgi:hypothetical protein